MRDPIPEPTDLAVAISVAQKMLAAYSDTSNFSESGYAQAHGALSESLRILLHALGADEKGSELVPTLGRDQPATDEETADRCPAAHPDDPTPCTGPPTVTVLDATNAGADGCQHHAARLLASLDRGRVYALPDAPEGAAIRVHKAADTTRPFAWVDGPRTAPSQLSHAENRRGGEGK